MREFAGGIAGQLGIIFGKLWRMESCQEARERLMSSFLPKKKEGGVQELIWPLNFMLILTKNCRLQDFSDEVKHFLKDVMIIRISQGSLRTQIMPDCPDCLFW